MQSAVFYSKIALFLLFVLSCGIPGTGAQTCIPDTVGEIELSDAVLSWEPSRNCEETKYIVTITSVGSLMSQYLVLTESLNISFLAYCRVYNFSILAIANQIRGAETYKEYSFPLPEDSDIAILNLKADLIDSDVLINWEVDRKFESCVRYYRLLIYDDESVNSPESQFLTQTGFLLVHGARCTNYRFEVTSYYTLIGTTGYLNYTVPSATNTPTLVAIRQNALMINTTWTLEKYFDNRCKVTALYVNGTRFNATYEIDDVPERPNIEVSITGLKANSMYYFNVSAENSAGMSKAYQMAVQTLPVQ